MWSTLKNIKRKIQTILPHFFAIECLSEFTRDQLSYNKRMLSHDSDFKHVRLFLKNHLKYQTEKA